MTGTKPSRSTEGAITNHVDVWADGSDHTGGWGNGLVGDERSSLWTETSEAVCYLDSLLADVGALQQCASLAEVFRCLASRMLRRLRPSVPIFDVRWKLGREWRGPDYLRYE